MAQFEVAVRGTEAQFRKICQLLNENTKAYTNTFKPGVYMSYATQQDSIFASYGWSREEFYKELAKRVPNIQ